MLHELEALEARRIADLAAEARKVRDRLLEKVPPAALGEPAPARGAHDQAHEVALDAVLADKAPFVALRRAIADLPREVRQAVWAVMATGRGDFAAEAWERAVAAASPLGDTEITAALADEPDLHTFLSKGLYQLGMVPRDNAG
jgi:hypothetical protein